MLAREAISSPLGARIVTLCAGRRTRSTRSLTRSLTLDGDRAKAHVGPCRLNRSRPAHCPPRSRPPCSPTRPLATGPLGRTASVIMHQSRSLGGWVTMVAIHAQIHCAQSRMFGPSDRLEITSMTSTRRFSSATGENWVASDVSPPRMTPELHVPCSTPRLAGAARTPATTRDCPAGGGSRLESFRASDSPLSPSRQTPGARSHVSPEAPRQRSPA